MSDISHGPDWWQDEEGNWHPPHIKEVNQNAAKKQDFSTDSDVSGEINEGNIASHFKERYGLERQYLTTTTSGAGQKGKPKPWVPSKGNTRSRFMHPTTPSDLFSGFLGALGAALLIIGSFMDWATAGGSLLTGGIDAIKDSNGTGTLVTGFLCGISSVFLLKGQRKRWVGLSLALTAIVALFLTIFSMADIINTSDGIPQNLIARFPTIDSTYANKAKLEFSAGLWLVLGGSSLSLLAGVSGFKRNA